MSRGKRSADDENRAGWTAIKIQAAASTNRIITQNLRQSYKLPSVLKQKTP